MRDKPLAMLAAALAVPLCAVCVVGPAFILASVSGWIGGLDPGLTVGLAVIAAIVAYGVIKRRKGRRSFMNDGGFTNPGRRSDGHSPNDIEFTNED